MGIFDLFQKSGKPNKSTSVRVGDWVTQYSAGYWMVTEMFPKYADEDYSYNGTSWRKGERLGNWVVLKKGFTPKMKPANACELVDAQWCKPVADDIRRNIESAFAENPKAAAKFENSPNVPPASAASAWMALTDAQAESFSELIRNLPDRFTAEQFWSLSADYRQYLTDPSEATHILNLFSNLWEIDDDFEPLHFKAELKRLR